MREILILLEKDKLTEYFKENSSYVKDLYRNPNNYDKVKQELKEKYNLRLRDKVNNYLDDIEMVTSIISTIS